MAGPTEYAEKALDKLNPPKPPPIPEDVQGKLKRGRERLKQVSAPRREAVEFANNNHYVGLNKDATGLISQSTVPVSQGGGKPDHRVRRSRDLIGPILQAKVSAANGRIPNYETVPSTPDSEDFTAARLSEKIARAGYDLWHFRTVFRKATWLALVTEEAFLMPYWDSSVGPFIDASEATEEEPEPKPQYVGMGEVAVGVWSGLEVGWEPGVDFEKSKFWFIDSARPAEQLEEEEGYIGGKLTADAESTEKRNKPNQAGSSLVLVTEFFERPCPKYPQGRRMVFANDRQLFPTEDYPLRDHKGNVIDEPCIHRLSYRIDGSSDRDRGLVRSLIESMRQYDHVWNKAAEWVQVALIPQLTAPEGALKTPITDEPGLVIEYDDMIAGQSGKPEWRTVPPVPQELFQIADRAQGEMNFIAQENSMAIMEAESGKKAQALASMATSGWEDFLENLAEVHARVMRDCLTIVQLRYSEERLVNFRGRTGWESIADFKGSDLRGQTDVRVSSTTLEGRTRQQTEQRITNIAQMFPGHFPPEVLLSALEGGNAEKLIEGYEDDVARANRVISQIRSGQFWSLPRRPILPGEESIKLNPENGFPEWEVPPKFSEDPETGEEVEIAEGVPLMETDLPGWMPRPFDNIAVHKSVFETWMKTDDWEQLAPPEKKASMTYYQALLDMESRKAQRDSELQSQMAESLGAANAAKPQGGKPMPSLPAAGGE